MMPEPGTRRVYPHMCRDGHPEIGHADNGEDERCPVCRERDRVETAEARLAEVERERDEADDVIFDFWGPKWIGRDAERINHSIERCRARTNKIER